ncbi:MAG: hypothetical protein ABF303_03810 [Desulfobacterales bacterium]
MSSHRMIATTDTAHRRVSFHIERQPGSVIFNTKIDEIGDILQLANGLNGPNRLNLTKARASARIN